MKTSVKTLTKKTVVKKPRKPKRGSISAILKAAECAEKAGLGKDRVR